MKTLRFRARASAVAPDRDALDAEIGEALLLRLRAENEWRFLERLQFVKAHIGSAFAKALRRQVESLGRAS